jgi:NADPH-dependent glutamate synthase beta subunit-like oxidoreductase
MRSARGLVAHEEIDAVTAETRRPSRWQEQSEGEGRVHDVVIVGAGPAGLGAAHELAPGG